MSTPRKTDVSILQTRRDFLGQGGMVMAYAGLASLLGGAGRTAGAMEKSAESLRLPHFTPKAKRAIYLFMAGAPSQIDTWDYKPKLADYFDQDLPESVRGGQVLTGMTSGQSRLPAAPSLFKF